MVVIFVCGSGGASILFPSTRDMVRGDSLVLWTTDIMWWSWWTGIIYMKRETKLISGIRNFNLISILSGDQWQFLLIWQSLVVAVVDVGYECYVDGPDPVIAQL